MYKNILKKAYCKYNRDFNEKLRVLRSYNAKEYWNIINGGTSQASVSNKIKMSELFDHFSKLNSSSTDDECNFDLHDLYRSYSVNNSLHRDITIVELNKVVNML